MIEYEESAEFAEESRPRRQRLRAFFARTEMVYLEILRTAALLVATLILAWIVWLLASSAYKISRDADAVEVADVAVSAQDVANIKMDAAEGGQAPLDRPKTDSAFQQFRRDYFSLYRTSFERYRHSDDRRLSEGQFADRFLQGFGQRQLDPLADAPGSYVSESDFKGLLETMRAAAKLPVTVERLSKYRQTPKVRVSNEVRRTRQEQYCEYYSSYDGECYYYGSRTVPYTQTVSRMKVPDGVIAPQDLFAAYQDNYLGTLYSGREKNSAAANTEKSNRLRANEEGWLGLSNAVWFGAVFFGVMFFFLLIAIERHQRVIAARLDPPAA